MTAKIVPLIPATHLYCEPFGGAASIMCALPPRPVEIYNDLDGNLVNLFRVLQNRRQKYALQKRLAYTPYSRAEFVLARRTLADPQANPLDRAWAFFTAQNQGFAGKANSDGDWGRGLVSSRGQAATVSKWRNRVARLDEWCERFARVQIERRDAVEVIVQFDTPDSCFYLDPPYMVSTRMDKNLYAHELDDAGHRRLLDCLLEIIGAAVLSAYNSAAYELLARAGWAKKEFKTVCYIAGRTKGANCRGAGSALKNAPRTEVIWINPRALALLKELGKTP